MATSGPKTPGTAANDNAAGTLAWSNPGNVAADDANYATCSSNSGAQSNYLKLTNWGFSADIGASDTINGIQVSIKRKAGYSALARYVQDYLLKLWDGSAPVGSSKADTATKWGTTDGTVNYGAVNDTWGWTPDTATVRSAGFGLVLQANVASNGVSVVASVNYVTMTITYTTASGQTKTASRVMLLGVGV